MLNSTHLEELSHIDVRLNEKLSKYTFTKVGGPADFLAFPENTDQVQELIKLANQTETPITVLGNASNLIVRDRGIRGLVILLEKMNKINIAGYTVEAQAGAILKEATEIACEQSLTGFEFACGIPGSVGGAVFMNAGAYGGEISDIFASCKVISPAAEIIKLTAEDMKFGYRYSAIREQGYTVLSAKFNLSSGDHEQIQAEMKRLNHLRELKQPLEYPSCGSVFKRPEGHFAGQLIQEAGLQGYRVGGIEVSTKHAGFMVNVANGTATDYEKLIAHVIEKVKIHSGITLEPEVRIIGERA